VVAQAGMLLEAADAVGDGEKALPALAVVLDRGDVVVAGGLQRHVRFGGAGMARDVGQRLLQDVEHLAFLLRLQAQVGEAVVVMQDDAGALAKADGKALQRMVQAHRVHAAAELHQQLAQVAVGIVQRLADIAGVLGGLVQLLVGDGVGQHGHAHLHVGQGLRQGIVDLGGHHLALAGEHDAQVLALEAGIFQRQAEVLADRAEQQRDFLGQLESLRQVKVVGAQQAPGVLQRHHHHGLAVGAEPVAVGAVGATGEVDLEAGLVLADGDAALAAVARDQALEFHHLCRQAARGDHAQMLAVAGQHAHHAGIGLGQADHGAEEAAEQFVEIVLVGEVAGDFGEDVKGLQRVSAGGIEVEQLERGDRVWGVHSGIGQAPEEILSAHIRAEMVLPSVISPSCTASSASATLSSMTSRCSPWSRWWPT
jgi:hypothetical protein